MGKLLLSLPCQKALPSAGRLDHPKALVAPRQAVAERSLEGISDRTAAHRVQAGRAGLTDPFASGRKSPFMKAGCGKTARPVGAADGGERKSNRARLLRPDTCEATEQGEATPGGSRGGKGLTQGEQPLGGRGSDTELKCRVDPNDGYAGGDGRAQIVHRTTSDPREEPGALAAHAGICAGGEEKSSSLPRPSACRDSNALDCRFQLLLAGQEHGRTIPLSDFEAVFHIVAVAYRQSLKVAP